MIWFDPSSTNEIFNLGMNVTVALSRCFKVREMARKQAEEKAMLEAKVARGNVNPAVACAGVRGTTQARPFRLSESQTERHSKAALKAEAEARHREECSFHPTTNESGSRTVVHQLLLDDDDQSDLENEAHIQMNSDDDSDQYFSEN
jgi:hypothetical protein